MTGLLSELKRRNVLRIGALYLASCWLLVQVASILLPAFEAPPWALRSLILLAALGLPLALALAWSYQLTPQGLRRDAGASDVAGVPASGADTRRIDRVIIVVLVLALCASLGWIVFRSTVPTPPAQAPAATSVADPQPRSLAVLPFRPLVATDRNESLELGMADTLITRVSGLRSLVVTPLSSVRRYAGTDQDALAVGRELGVQAVLEGSIQREGDRLRVSARLVNVSDGRPLWADSFHEPFTGIFAVQDAIAERIAADLALELADARRVRDRRHTRDAEAYRLYVEGRYLWDRRRPPDLVRAIEYFERAAARDPNYALPHAAVSDCLAVLSVLAYRPPHEVYPKAKDAALRALALDPQLANAHAALGHIAMNYERDLPRAMKHFERAFELDPRYAQLHMWIGILRSTQGDHEAALQSARRALQLEPQTIAFHLNLGMVLYFARRHDEAIAALERTLAMDPTLPPPRALLVRALVETGRADRALEILPPPGPAYAPLSSTARIVALARAGRTRQARRELRDVVSLAEHQYVPAYDIAAAYAALGDEASVYAWLERAVEERSTVLPLLVNDPLFHPYRDRPPMRRFVELSRSPASV